MRISHDRPPIWDAAMKIFPITDQVIFCFGDTIYNPGKVNISDALQAHEEVHMQQQALTTPEEWWVNYLTSKSFRFAQELPAHVREYEWHTMNSNRHSRRAALVHVSKRLSSRLYGNLVTKSAAKRMIQHGH